MATASKDWFRKTTWTETDQIDFFARLQRCRSAANKAQYLRIQANHLEEVGSPELLQSALVLLEKILNEFPTSFELAQTYSQKASCLAKLGKIDEALSFYRLAINTEKKFPRVGTRAWISFGRVVAENKLTTFFTEALDILKAQPTVMEFPADTYEKSGICAIISAQRGETEAAKNLAVSALKAAAEVHSGFRYHPTVGLVRDKESRFYKSIEAIAQTGILK